MRTTLVLDDRVFRAAKRTAARRGITLSALVNEALRATLATPAARPGHFEMVTYGRGKPVARHEPADFAAALSEEDRSALSRG